MNPQIPAADLMTLPRTLHGARLDAFGAELDALYREHLADRGAKDAAHIHRIERLVRYTGAGGRLLLALGWLPPAWVAGTALLSVSKILDNMELGHNVMHGQYDFLREARFAGQRFDWDNVCPADAWRHTHNHLHHTYTNVLGVDRDIGYGLLRLFPDQPWTPQYLLQPFSAAALALFFEWGVAVHGLDLDQVLIGKKPLAEVRADVTQLRAKIGRQLGRDYLFWPLLAGPSFLPMLAGSAVANLARNVWAFSIIFCGHFTTDAEVFPPACLENESRGHWFLRQLKGSSNLSGGRWFQILNGHLGYQIEHHMFPDVPAWRYPAMGRKVEQICRKYDLPYNTGPLSKQLAQVAWRVFRHAWPSKPDRALSPA